MSAARKPSRWWCAACNGTPVWGKPVRYARGRWFHTDPIDCRKAWLA